MGLRRLAARPCGRSFPPPIRLDRSSDWMPYGTDGMTAHGRLMLTVLGGLAEFEREPIRARTIEGPRLAIASGVKLGRRPKLTAHRMKEALRRGDACEAVREIAWRCNVSHSTISRLAA
jgi:DNA invertase Pin-like site-specific DNA recombinase